MENTDFTDFPETWMFNKVTCSHDWLLTERTLKRVEENTDSTEIWVFNIIQNLFDIILLFFTVSIKIQLYIYIYIYIYNINNSIKIKILTVKKRSSILN